MKRLVRAGRVPGLLGYLGGKPVAWCSLGPREQFPILENSRVLARVDAQPVWSVVCFFIARGHRRQGLSAEMLRAAVRYARRCGARIVEGYPSDPLSGHMADTFAWTGLASAYETAEFKEVARRSKSRPIMRIGE